jgi:predicted O-methyltransferase YrrM
LPVNDISHTAAVAGSDQPPVYLDSLPLLDAEVGYGALGRGGSLGYEGKPVLVQGRSYAHALSTHAPARLSFRLGDGFSTFRCEVGLNDDVHRGISDCSFAVLADGREVCTAHVAAGDRPQPLVADIAGAQRLDLVVTTSRWEYCHSVWLDPQVDVVPLAASIECIIDCMGRTEIMVPAVRPRSPRCIATLATGSYASMLDDLLGSLFANGACQDALVVVFSVGDDPICRRIATKYGATVIPCTLKAPLGVSIKALLYSVARVVDASQFLCLDADMLVLQDLRPLFGAIAACPEGTILACREGNGDGYRNLEHILTTAYGGRASDIELLLGAQKGEGSYPLVVNDGLFAGSRTAFLALDNAISRMRNAAGWVEERRDLSYRNQFIFNLALAQLGCGVELDPTWNLQLHVQNAALAWSGGRMSATWNGRAVRVLHFSGGGRHKYPEWRNLFARVAEPLLGGGDGDLYADFLWALRAWTGRLGVAALTWSFYGTSDAKSARVRDPSVLPLLGLLHYIIRANGCVRVLETGTAKGVSAACLASAVACRDGGCVVTFDPTPQAERLDLWQALPAPMAASIEQRTQGSLEGMAAAFAAGERYEAALLDSIHTEDHVWAEFQLASRLVCSGGLILIHDVRLQNFTVERALKRIEAAGYGVTRLWTADAGVIEDDYLGLAVIENRHRKES